LNSCVVDRADVQYCISGALEYGIDDSIVICSSSRLAPDTGRKSAASAA